jgi:hypothetical protein
MPQICARNQSDFLLGTVNSKRDWRGRSELNIKVVFCTQLEIREIFMRLYTPIFWSLSSLKASTWSETVRANFLEINCGRYNFDILETEL